MVFSFTNLVALFAQAEPPQGFRAALDSVWNFFYTGGWYMFPILLCSFAALTLVVFKFIDLRRDAIVPSQLASALDDIETLTAAGRLGEMQRLLRGDESTLAHICRHALLSSHSSKEEAERSTEAVAREEVSKLERGIPALEVIFTIAPLLGLIGTVSGLVTIFGTFGTQAGGPAQAQSIAKGISEALNTTIAGLVVAVPSYIFQSYFSRRLEGLALRMGTLTTGLLNAAYRTTSELPEVVAPAPAKKSKRAEILPETDPAEA